MTQKKLQQLTKPFFFFIGSFWFLFLFGFFHFFLSFFLFRLFGSNGRFLITWNTILLIHTKTPGIKLALSFKGYLVMLGNQTSQWVRRSETFWMIWSMIWTRKRWYANKWLQKNFLTILQGMFGSARQVFFSSFSIRKNASLNSKDSKYFHPPLVLSWLFEGMYKGTSFHLGETIVQFLPHTFYMMETSDQDLQVTKIKLSSFYIPIAFLNNICIVNSLWQKASSIAFLNNLSLIPSSFLSWRLLSRSLLPTHGILERK